MTSKLQCVDCKVNTQCPTYEIIENTLDTAKVHYKLNLTLGFIFTVNKPDEFRETFYEQVGDISISASVLSEFIQKQINKCDCVSQQLGAKLDLMVIPNKQAFEELSEYIKVTHEEDNE